MLQRRTAGSRMVEYAGGEERLDIPNRPGATSGSATSMFQVLWRRKWIILCCAVVALGSGIVYLTQATKIYSSSSQIYIQQRSISPFEGMVGGGVNSLNFLATQCDVIRSTTVLTEALKSPEIGRAESLKNADSPLALLKFSITAAPGKQSDIITVNAESPFADDAAVFANAAVNAYIDYENKMHRSTATEIVNALQNMKQDEDKEYKRVSDLMLAFKRDNGTFEFAQGQGNVVISKLQDLSGELTKAQIASMQSSVAYETATAFADNPAKLQQLMNSSGIRGLDGSQALRSEINQVEMTLNDMETQYGKDYPAAKTLRARLERLRALLDDSDKQAAATYLAALKAQADQAKQQVDRLKAAVDEQQNQAIALNAKAAQYQQYQNELTRNEKLVDFLDQRIKEFSFNASEDQSQSVSVLEVAKPAFIPVRPNPPQVLAIALAIGLMAGMGGALLLDWMDHRIRSAAEVENLLGLPILGAIPHMLGKRSAMERGQEIHLYPKSEVAESYRTIRTGIRFGVTDASSRTLLVTSPSPGDGKTTVASNLAIAIAQTGKKVLLLDADCRRPMINRIYQLTQETGLSTVLAGQCDLDSAIHHSSTENLDILPCGPLPPNPAEMLNSEAFTSLLRELASRYDQVVVDSPPVAPVTDARILAAACDATVLVIRAEKTSRRVAEHARDAMVSVGAVILGVVVNDAPRSRSEGSSYGHYHYGYGYGYGAKPRAKEVKAISVSKPA